MFFGVALSPTGWLMVAISALFIMLAPLAAIEALAGNLAEPYRAGAIFLGSYVVWPVMVAWLYKSRLRKTGRGSAIFYFYVVLYCLLFAIFLVKVFSGSSSEDDYIGALVLGSVSLALIWFAVKTRRTVTVFADISKAQAEEWTVSRSDDLRRQAEAILLAEEMKNQRNQT